MSNLAMEMNSIFVQFGKMLSNRIEEFRNRLGLTMEQLAKRVGTTASTINKLEKGQRKLTQGWLLRLAPALNCGPSDLIRPSNNALEIVREPLPPTNVTSISVPARLDSYPDIPVPLFSMGRGDRSEAFVFDLSKPLLEIRRPIGLAGRDRIYALRVEGDWMSPIHEDGHYIFVDPGRRPYPGRDAIIKLHPEGTGEPARALFRRVMAITDTAVTLKEWQPEERVFQVPIARIDAMHLVLQNHEMY